MTDLAIGLRTRPDRGTLLRALQEYGVYAAVLALLIVDALSLPYFVEMSNLRVQLYQIVPTLLVSLGMALVIGTEGIDLSVGAVIALAAALIPLYLGYGAPVAIAAALLGGAMSGLIGGSMVAFGRVQPIVATLSLMIGLRGVAIIFNGAQDKPIDNATVNGLGINTFAGIPDMAWLAVVIVLVLGFVVRRTVFGRQLVAIGDNREASRLSGLPVRRVLLTVYIVSGVLAALAGLLIVGHDVRAAPSLQGLNMELSAITAVVVGGTPLSGGKVRVLGTVAGAVFMQLVIATLQQHNIDNAYSQIVEAIIICLAVWAARERKTR
jgi:ribose/xylose/arabinose/galactoside ABC-type transport system permease subunit